MTERHHAQLTLTSIILYGLAAQSPDELMDPELRRIDGLLADRQLVDIVLELGVKRAVIPKPGYRSQTRRTLEKQRWFRRGRAWRAGGEARISRLKRRFGMARTPNRGAGGMERTAIWAGIANNLAVIAR